MTPAAAGLVLTLVSTAYTAYSSQQTANFNTALAKQDADYAVQVGEVNAEEARRDFLRHRGETKVTVANSGADLLSTSVLAADAESARESAIEISNIKSGAQSRARGSLLSGEQGQRKAQATTIGAGVTAGTTLLSHFN